MRAQYLRLSSYEFGHVDILDKYARTIEQGSESKCRAALRTFEKFECGRGGKRQYARDYLAGRRQRQPTSGPNRRIVNLFVVYLGYQFGPSARYGEGDVFHMGSVLEDFFAINALSNYFDAVMILSHSDSSNNITEEHLAS